jgi:hypothetical protein
MCRSHANELSDEWHATLGNRFMDLDLTYPTQEETPLDRELQATELARIMSATYPDPLIFLGYVVTDRGRCHLGLAQKIRPWTS